MDPKGPGQVVCAHCTRADAVDACLSCTRQVCARCRVDWTTCPVPCGRELRLGTGGRLHDVSYGGQLALVANWRGRGRLLDLRRGRYLSWDEADAQLAAARDAISAVRLVRLSDDAGVVFPEFRTISERVGTQAVTFEIISGLHRTSLRQRVTDSVASNDSSTGRPESIDPREDELWLSRGGDWVWHPTMDEKVQLFDLEHGGRHRVIPVPRTVLQATWFDGPSRILATGVYGRVLLHRLVGDGCEKLAELELPDADIISLELSMGVLFVLAGRRGGEATLSLYRLADDSLGPAHYSRRVHGALLAAMTTTGSHIAVGRTDHVVELHQPRSRTCIELDGHTDRLRLLRFVRQDSELVSADDDNRIILRPLTGGTYASRVLPVELPSEPIALRVEDLTPS